MKKIVLLVLILALLSAVLPGCYPNPTFYDVAKALQGPNASWMINNATGEIFGYFKVGIASTGEALYRWATTTAMGTELFHSGPTLARDMLNVVNIKIAMGFQYVSYFDINPVAMSSIIITIITYMPQMAFFVFNPSIIYKFYPTQVPDGYVQAYP